jgi:hypothetical protein
MIYLMNWPTFALPAFSPSQLTLINPAATASPNLSPPADLNNAAAW